MDSKAKLQTLQSLVAEDKCYVVSCDSQCDPISTEL